MHYSLEVILPAGTEDIEAALESILLPFHEERKNEDGEWESNPQGFLDYYTVGGRWSGKKRQVSLDPAKLEEFTNWMVDTKITVSSLQFGKQELQPASQIEVVDRKWNEMFPHPSGQLVPCPIFKHSGEDGIDGDICKLSEVSDELSASRLILAGPSYADVPGTDTRERIGPAEACEMLTAEFWNGCTWQSTDWDGNVKKGIERFKEKFSNTSESPRAAVMPTDDSIVVTVDYHS